MPNSRPPKGVTLHMLSANQIAARCNVSPATARTAMRKALGPGTRLFGSKLERWHEHHVIRVINDDLTKRDGTPDDRLEDMPEEEAPEDPEPEPIGGWS